MTELKKKPTFEQTVKYGTFPIGFVLACIMLGIAIACAFTGNEKSLVVFGMLAFGLGVWDAEIEYAVIHTDDGKNDFSIGYWSDTTSPPE